MKVPMTACVLLALGALLGGGLFWGLRAERPRPSQTLGISFTADVRGRLVPCGCFSGQMGGLTRVATLLESRQTAPGAGLCLDVGDAIAGTEDFQRIEYGYILQAFARMGYEAANMGHREAALSAAQLREFKARSPVPMLSANLLEKATGRPLFESHRIVRRGAWRIALVGALDSHIAPEALGEGLAVEPMETALARLLPELRKKADVIVLLAFADEAALQKLARDFYEIDVILGGKVSQPSQLLIRENRSLILFTTNESRALGLLELSLAAPGRIEPLSGEVVLVHDKIAEAPGIRALASEYRAEVRRTRLAVDDPAALQADRVPGVEGAAAFVGTQNCVSCHASAAKAWAASSHSKAFATLVAHGAEADPSCIGCHTVGFGSPGGFRRGSRDEGLVNVGCESCHGPGGQHAAQRRAGLASAAPLRSLGAGDCQKCHHGEFSRPFSWDAFWPHVSHGK